MQDQKCRCSSCGEDAICILFHEKFCLKCAIEARRLVDMVICAVQAEAAIDKIQH